MDAPLSNTGIVLLAQEIDDNTFFDGDLQQLTIVGNPEAAYEQCTEYITDCNEPLPAAAVNDEGLAGYRGIDEDELLNREGLSPREYLEFTERERVAPPPAGMTLAGSAFCPPFPDRNLAIALFLIYQKKLLLRLIGLAVYFRTSLWLQTKKNLT